MTVLDSHRHPLGEVFVSRRRELWSIAAKIVRQSDCVDDVLQDAYIKLAEGMLVRDIEKPFQYCCQVVRSVALDYCRRRSSETKWIVQTVDGELPDVGGGVEPDSGLDAREILEAVELVLAALPARTRLAFELYRIEGVKQREIARRFGVSPTLVNFMIKDAMSALMRCHALFYEQ